MNNETLAYFFVFFISTLIGFGFIYKHATQKVARYRPHLCIEQVLARCSPADESEKIIRQEKSRANGGLSLGAQEFFSEERRKNIVEMYVKKDSDQYTKVLSAFNEAFDRKDEEMLICLEKYMTTYNYEPSCLNLKAKEISSEMMILYFGGAILFALLVTLFCYGISIFFL
jgi:hypothetical protein